MGRIIKEGKLVKSPPESKMKNAASWHKRYFVLAEIDEDDRIPKCKKKQPTEVHSEKVGVYLMYWDNRNDRTIRKRPKRIVAVTSNCKIMKSEFNTFPHTMENLIQLVTPRRLFILSASSKEIQEEWYDCLYTAICTEQNEPVYDRIYDTILDFVYLIDNENEKDTDTVSCSSRDSRRSTESIEEQEGSKDMLYEPMSSTSDDGGRGSIGSMEGIYQHPRRRRSSRFGSVSSLNSEVGIQIVGNGLKEITFYDVKLLVPDNATLTLVQDSIEIRTDRSICKIEKDVSNTTHNTKL